MQRKYWIINKNQLYTNVTVRDIEKRERETDRQTSSRFVLMCSSERALPKK